MMRITRYLALTALLFAAVPATILADDVSHRQQVQTLFQLTQMQKKIEDSVNSVLQLQLRSNPQLAPHEAKVREFLERHMGWASMKDDLTDMYMKAFSEKELETINNFYITPEGQKVITVLPQLVQQRNQLAMTRLQQNVGELHKLIGTPSPH